MLVVVRNWRSPASHITATLDGGGKEMYRGSVPTIQEIKQRNIEVGQHFFDEEAMRFFDSRIYKTTHGFHFTTSERGPSGVRRYSVRVIDWTTGHIETVGNFQQFATLREAYKFASKQNLDSLPQVG